MAATPTKPTSGARGSAFLVHHLLSHGLKIVARDANGRVTIVECQFCAFHGRALKKEGKRARTRTVKQWTSFRKDQFDSHHSTQHEEQWKIYRELSEADKTAYFLPKQVSMNRFLEKTAPLRFSVVSAIVENIIGDMFFRDDDDEAGDGGAKYRAVALFKLEDQSTPPAYSVKINNPARFNLALDNVSVGLSFRQVAAVMKQYQLHTKDAKLSGLSARLVGDYVRVLVGINLQKLSDILSSRDTWAFSLACDGSTHRGVAIFDVRVRLCAGGALHNLHVVVVPFYERHTASNIVALIVKLLDNMETQWRDKLLAVTTDGENTMTGRLTGVVTQLSRLATYPILRIWCAPHQADLVVKATTQHALGGQFSKLAHGWSVHLRLQQNLITEMGSKCPKDTTRWVQFGEMIGWMLTHRVRLLAHATTKEESVVPPNEWWLLAAAVQPMLATINVTLVILQDKLMVLSQQASELDRLVLNLCVLLNIRLIQEDVSYERLLPTEYYRGERWWVRFECVRAHINDQGSWTREPIAGLSSDQLQEVVLAVATYGVRLVDGLSSIQAERDTANRSAEDAPPVMPSEIVRLRPSHFVAQVLDPRRDMLSVGWSTEDIEAIEREQRDVRTSYLLNQTSVKLKIDRHTAATDFNTAWDDVSEPGSRLRCFLGGLASAFANSTSVEADFSLVKWEKDAHRSRLTSLSLEGILQAKQRQQLASIAIPTED